MLAFGLKRKARRKKGARRARTAQEPRQTINIDLCFVPATHEPEHKLPAVSGSSGRLVVERLAEERAERQWPGRVFEDEERDYTQAMLDYVAASKSQADADQTKWEEAQQCEEASLKARKRALQQEEEQLRADRRAIRQQRAQEDAAWKTLRDKRNQENAAQKNLPLAERKAQDERWRTLRDQRRATRVRRKQENKLWWEKRRNLRERWSQLPLVTAWIAILVIMDNCTRQCLGLPLFGAGSQVTAPMIVEALRVLLPAELQFLISDRGTHFTSQAFADLADDAEFIHVVIARQRPQSNGIAERFVRTLKGWLREKSWQDDQELAELRSDFLSAYNDRPHQGLPVPGLSPNEFAKRIWLW